MHLERFHQWLAAVPAQARADAAQALISAYGHIGTDRQRADSLDRMVAILLEDPSIVVRRSMAEAASRSIDVPRWVVVALAQDDTPVSVPVLIASPLLSEADLVDAVAAGDGDAQCAVASRAGVSESVAAALVEAGHREAVLALCTNPTARVPPVVLRRVLQRFGEDAAMREALLAHAHHDPALHHELVLASTEALTRFALACDWMSPSRADAVRRETHDKGVVTIAAGARDALGPEGPRALVVHLRAHGQLTPALLLRALLSGNLDLCEAALSHLSGIAPARVAGHVRTPQSLGFASLYAKAAMPPALLPVFQAALQAAATLGRDAPAHAVLSRAAITQVLDLCLRSGMPDLARVAALLRRLEAEACRDNVRIAVRDEEEPVRHRGAPDFATMLSARPRGQLSFQAAA